MNNRQLIKEIIIEQQKFNSEIISNKKIIPRTLLDEQITNLKMVKVISGIRRSGKSVAANLLFHKNKLDYIYVNFDDERLAFLTKEQLNDVIESINEINPTIKNIIFDEIQNIFGWELFVNRLIRSNYNLIVTGSNANLLSKELSTHLTGRYLNFELYPFSFKEFLLFHNKVVDNKTLVTADKAELKVLLEQYIKQGGFPEIINNSLITDSFAIQYLQTLFDTLINKDIISRFKIKQKKNIKDLAFFLITNFSSIISLHKLKNIFAIGSVNTIKNYLFFLQETYLIFLLPPFSHKVKEKFNYEHKVYAIDTGLISALLPMGDRNRGKLLENLVFIELKKNNKEIYYVRTKNKKEVDFVVSNNAKVVALIQVCYDLSAMDTFERECSALYFASLELHCDNLTIITWDEENKIEYKGKTIIVIPAYKYFTNNN